MAAISSGTGAAGSPFSAGAPPPSLPLSPNPPKRTRILGADASDPCVGSCARSVTHQRVRALACSSPPSAHLAPHPNLLRPLGGSGLGLFVGRPPRRLTRLTRLGWRRVPPLIQQDRDHAQHDHDPDVLRVEHGGEQGDQADADRTFSHAESVEGIPVSLAERVTGEAAAACWPRLRARTAASGP